MKINGKDDIPYIMENKTCLKPSTYIFYAAFPASFCMFTYVYRRAVVNGCSLPAGSEHLPDNFRSPHRPLESAFVGVPGEAAGYVQR